ncbi:MAG: HAMP domain-containing histidine kinase [Cytophagales bacterium]|nr:HAMP domain-containing histidine kinase [Cytophagales bacterium]
MVKSQFSFMLIYLGIFELSVCKVIAYDNKLNHNRIEAVRRFVQKGDLLKAIRLLNDAGVEAWGTGNYQVARHDPDLRQGIYGSAHGNEENADTSANEPVMFKKMEQLGTDEDEIACAAADTSALKHQGHIHVHTIDSLKKLIEIENMIIKEDAATIVRDRKIISMQKWIIGLAVFLLLFLFVFSLIFYRKNKLIKSLYERLAAKADKITYLNNNLEFEVEQRTKELRQAIDSLEIHNRNLEKFSYVISHHLRAPIARLLGLSNIFDYSRPGSEMNNEILLKTKECSEELDDVVRDLAAILVIKKHNNLDKKEIELESILGSIKSELGLNDRNIIVFADANDRLPTIYSHEPYFKNILYQLISNSVKFKKNKLPPIIQIMTKQLKEGLHVMVRDNGIGIQSQFLSQIFMPYKKFTGQKEGKGLGLYYVQSYVEALGGRINVKSLVNEGTTFDIYLPGN